MLNISAQQDIWLCTQPTDMRRSFDGLSAQVSNHLGSDPANGHWYACINRRRTQIKVLAFEEGGYCPVCLGGQFASWLGTIPLIGLSMTAWNERLRTQSMLALESGLLPIKLKARLELPEAIFLCQRQIGNKVRI